MTVLFNISIKITSKYTSRKKSIIRVGKEHFVKIKETIHQEAVTIINVVHTMREFENA